MSVETHGNVIGSLTILMADSNVAACLKRSCEVCVCNPSMMPVGSFKEPTMGESSTVSQCAITAMTLWSRDPEVLGGELVFAGTRVPVRSLFDHLEAGDALADFLDGFPSVSRVQAIAALEECWRRTADENSP